ncbi:MAG: transposase [Candidatus Omnitrophica bacterium]|nr:transposase [Candidatus Omnitrophota bacterium]
MPRTARVTVENGCYHIITRGNQKQFVFLEPYDYEKYISMLTRYKKKYKFKLYSFCLMPNHVHLIIEVSNANLLNKIMGSLNLSYTLYFNLKYHKVGHLWQDRFKSKIIEKSAYLIGCINYIEANPVRASLTSQMKEYRWSSYNLRGFRNNLLDDLFAV